MKCSLCGKPVEDGAAFCPFCGMRLGQRRRAHRRARMSRRRPLRLNNSPLRRLGQALQKALCPAWGRHPRPACRRTVARRHMASPTIPSRSRECLMGAQMGRLPG